jgi:hypothetical protein
LKTINRGLGHDQSTAPTDCNLPYRLDDEVKLPNTLLTQQKKYSIVGNKELFMGKFHAGAKIDYDAQSYLLLFQRILPPKTSPWIQT